MREDYRHGENVLITENDKPTILRQLRDRNIKFRTISLITDLSEENIIRRYSNGKDLSDKDIPLFLGQVVLVLLEVPEYKETLLEELDFLFKKHAPQEVREELLKRYFKSVI